MGLIVKQMMQTMQVFQATLRQMVQDHTNVLAKALSNVLAKAHIGLIAPPWIATFTTGNVPSKHKLTSFILSLPKMDVLSLNELCLALNL